MASLTTKIITSIDIGDAMTKVVIAQMDSTSPYPTILGTGNALTNGMKDGYIVNQNDVEKSLKKAVKEAEKTAGIKIKRAVVGINSFGLTSHIAVGSAIVSRADGEVSSHDIDKAIKESAKDSIDPNKKILYHLPIEFRIDGKDILGTPEGTKGIKLETRVLFVTAFTKHIDTLFETTENIDIEVSRIIPSPIALAAVALSEKQKTVGCLLVDIGGDTVSVGLYENGMPLGIHVFPVGSSDITNDIAIGLKTSLEEAEQIKLGSYGLHPKRKVDDIINARLDDIYDLIDRYLKKMKRSELLPAGIILVGGGAMQSGIEERTKDALRLPARIGFTEFFIQSKNKWRDASWASAYGLILYSFNRTDDTEKKSTLKEWWTRLFKQLMP